MASDIDSSESLSTCEYEKAMEEYDRDVKKSLEDSEKRTEELIEKYRSKSTYTNQ